LFYQPASGSQSVRMDVFEDSVSPAAGAALVNAVCDALVPFDVQLGAIPLSPEMILRNLR